MQNPLKNWPPIASNIITFLLGAALASTVSATVQQSLRIPRHAALLAPENIYPEQLANISPGSLVHMIKMPHPASAHELKAGCTISRQPQKLVQRDGQVLLAVRADDFANVADALVAIKNQAQFSFIIVKANQAASMKTCDYKPKVVYGRS